MIKKNKANHMKCFTLIELLVVIAVISTLASFLIPALSKARKASQALVSMGNMKQINLAMTMYLLDNEDRYTHHVFFNHYTWDDYLNPYIGNDMTEAEKLSDAPSDRSSFKIFKCPLDNLQRTSGNLLTRTYQVNRITKDGSKRIFHGKNGSGTPQQSLKQNELPFPVETIILLENPKAANSIGRAANAGLKQISEMPKVTTSPEANHHDNGFKNPLIFADGHGEVKYMPTTRANNDYLWSSKVY